MPVYLGEDQGGRVGPEDTIGFPNLRLCQAVVCEMSDGTLVGGHFTGRDDQTLINDLANDLNFDRNNVNQVTVAYDSRHMNVRENRKETDANGKAKLLGQSEVQYLDLAKIRADKAEVTYLEVSMQNGAFKLSALNNNRMDFTSIVAKNENFQQLRGQMAGQNGVDQFLTAAGKTIDGNALPDVSDQLENVEVKNKRTIKEVLEDKAKSVAHSARDLGNSAKESVKSKVGLQ